MLGYHWQGNVRELRSAMEYAAALAPDDLVEPSDLPETVLGTTSPVISPSTSAEIPAVTMEIPSKFRAIGAELAELERTRMAQALTAAEGVKTKAAQLIGMPIRTFTHKLRTYKL